MKETQSAYREIMKATSIFGGVQVLQIIIAIIRSKFIAVLLGPAGVGINGLLTSTTNFISSLTNFGLGTSAVKNVSAANVSNDSRRVGEIVAVLRKLVWITGLLGSLLTLALSPWLSQLTFGNKEYTMAFVWVSVTLLFNQVSTGQIVLLRGLRKLHYLAKSSLSGAFLGLVISVPIYFRWGVDGIVPAIIIGSIVKLAITWYYARKVPIDKVEPASKTLISEGKDMLRMGFLISLSGLITLGVSYVVRIYISNTGGIEQVGLYAAGFAIIKTYVGMIFTAMSTDYYPRLSSVAHDNVDSKKVINQQAEIAILVLAPVVVLFLVFINWVVIILYSTKFIPVNDMILFAAMGMFFKAASWAVAFIFLAKSASRLFFWNEFLGNIYFLALNILGYKYYGLTGLGISFMLGYLIYLIQVFSIAKIKYKFSFSFEFVQIFVFQFLNAIVCLIVVKSLPTPYSYVVGAGLFINAGWFSYIQLDKRLDLRSIINLVKKKYWRK